VVAVSFIRLKRLTAKTVAWFDASHRPGMTVDTNHVAHRWPLCYKVRMSPDRQTIASRVVLDDRSRLPWRFFGRLTTAALAA
jgi:hypothetical protein